MITFRIPTADPYAYIEIETDDMTAEVARKIYDEYTAAFKDKEGLPDKEWNELLDTYRREKGMVVDIYEKLSEKQSWLIHQLDKSNTRLAYKASKDK